MSDESDAVSRQNAQERAVGISVFVKPEVPGFQCVVKQRYTDFLVNEVLPNGEVLHLTDVSHDQNHKRKREPEDESQKKKKKLKENGHADATVEANEMQKDSSGDAVHADALQNGSEAQVEADAEASAEDIKVAKAQAIASIADADKAVLKDVFGDDTTFAILGLYANVIAYPERKARNFQPVNSSPIAEKSKRTEAHLCIRRIFSSKLETLTVQDQEHKSGAGTVIEIKAAPPKAPSSVHAEGRKNDQQRGKQNWSDLGGEYLHFTLYKENKDTMEVLYFLASQLKMHMKHFGFAGTKDRRGVTVQRVSIHRVRRERLEQLNKHARGFRVGGPWEYRTEGLDLGMAKGNEFMITLRDARFEGITESASMDQKLQHAQGIAKAAASNLAASGFLNYYGLQRFGTHSNGTHAIGMKMLQGDLKGAIDSILSYDPTLLEEDESAQSNGDNAPRRMVPQEDVYRARAIHAFRKSGTSGEALSHLPGNRFSAEKGLITHLGKRDRKTGRLPNENDYQGALMMIQRNLRLMYVHAYQSFVWNTVAGKRWERSGDKVVEGDLVVVGEKDTGSDPSNSIKAPAQEVDDHGEPVVHPNAPGDKGNDGGEAEDPFVRARPLSKDEAESGRFDIFDLVLPLPGFDVVYPKNEVGKFYEDFMASEEGGKLDPHNMRRSWKDISLSGGYRKMFARPLGEVEVDVKAYSGLEEQMVETDLERLSKDSESEAEARVEKASSGEKDKLAILLKLKLGSSQYATMALRELSKGGAIAFTPSYSVTNR
ncbi:uncharacterized protein MYCFIDRAFT_214017 [Pseudocercospora fijiensis CIRAD86]|uniref:TRUD domain-containing protein n=1 Tax=Pseudocercospora fijiensis (strain CIRAD86) TaxID=383855 RepID=M3AMM9_PSEFD|nr:uncharacterized protein MYCFIDRAFT_214017 [Pseudocercospora fijiensis CIRAD86]EME85831.1 hypothetical protein MYCFIDRAFT_214017 [Pseudocercospora fijiensis CIRAD86]